ncbi:heterodisulfide reductase, subunit A/methylviologen reducing hydrogenase, subunit delta [Olavius algarvensis associated proteobacterium Delta 3]|nr:heterodisulfide reductase, subunit A/methylviologen reducing hydrogenase, subunit delta [Olavius algarvensis associated proteobacterium Delta 3]
MEKCIACGTCYEKCPAKTADEYNEGLAKRKAIYVPYPQAVPLKYVIDEDRCIYFKKGKCKACEKFCPTDAIVFDDKEENLTLNVGSVIVTSGLKPFDPAGLDNYKHAAFPNVLTSLEFERILSAGGPTTGHVARPSDGEEPKKIAWLQCVGSRDLNRCDNEYCSSVCCMYAIKEAIVAKEHVGAEFEPTIFYMDMRTHGKDFERYYNRAQDEGVRFVRSRVHTILQKDASGTLEVQYVTDEGTNMVEDFDMVVLSVGMEPSATAPELADTLGIELNDYRFVNTEDTAPVTTSRPGVYVAGVIQGCKDIPQSVMEASAAACQAGISLAGARGSAVIEPASTEETDVRQQDPRIGVFVCNCGVNIGGFADVPAIAEYARSLPNVAYVEENLFTCAQDTQDKMVELIKEHDLNRIVVAACTPRTHEPLFQETVRNAGLNAYLFEMANIRNQCTWVHSNNKDIATEKSKDLVRMAISRAALLEPIPDLSVDVKKSALIIGGGAAGMNAALSLADQGFPAVLVETSDTLGGSAKDVQKTAGGQDVQAFLEDMTQKVKNHPHIEVLLNSEIVGASGFVGNFEAEISTNGQTRTIEHGATIIATGGSASETEEYLYGKSDRVFRWHDLENDPKTLETAKAVAFIQCVGSRDDNRPYCSRICCTASVLQAIAIKEDNPDTDVYVLYRDMRTFGEREILYKKARQLGVIFIRYSLDRKPVVIETKDGLEITVFDPILQQNLILPVDLLNLQTAIVPTDNTGISEMYKIPMNEDSFFMEAHAKLRPVEFATDGVFLCGIAHYPKSLDESLAQSMAAASRAATVLARATIQIAPTVSQIDPEMCIGCSLCEEVCPFGAIAMDEVEGKGYRARNIAASCKGCGLCASSCPQKAIDMLHFRDGQIAASVSAVA